jgi:hypothetical protein
MSYIIYPEDNQVAVIIPSVGITKEELLEVVPTSTYKIIENIDFLDRAFFNAYEFDQELGAKINISKAKEIWKDKFRVARRSILEKLDVEYMRALESGDPQKQQEIAAKKQELRDITNTSLPNSLEDIKNTWPNVLNT